MAANSEFTRQRIHRVWDVESTVIYPPVDTESIVAGGIWTERLTDAEVSVLNSLPSDFILGASRFVPYKRLDLVIEAAARSGLPAVIAGRGPEETRLRHLSQASRASVSFVISPSNALLYALYQKSIALIFPAIEDFGIMPVEAMAAGTPVIVPSEGGAAESVTLLKGGVCVDLSSPDWNTALEMSQRVDRAGLPGRANHLSNSRFRHSVRQWIAGRSLSSPTASLPGALAKMEETDG